MKKKFIIYIFLTVFTSSLMVSVFISLYSKYKFEKQIADKKIELIKGVEDQYQYISSIIEMAKRQICFEYKTPIIDLSNQLSNQAEFLNNITSSGLKRFAQNVNVEHLYIINKEGIIINSTQKEEIGYNLYTESDALMKSIKNLFVTNKFECMGFASSSIDNTPTFYMYYAPENANFILESSISMQKYLETNYNNGIADVVFWRNKEEIVKENSLINKFEVYNLIDGSKTSLLNTKARLTLKNDELKELEKKGVLSKGVFKGEDYYKIITLNNNSSEFQSSLLMHVNFDYTSSARSFWKLILLVVLIIFIVPISLSLITLKVANNYFIPKIKIINHNLESLKLANYHDFKNFDGIDELSIISSNIIDVKNNVMLREKQLLEAKSKAEEADQLKLSFLANMSHEIRTPLNAIVGFSQFLGEMFSSNKEVDSFTTIISENSERLLKTITDIIDVSKIESGQFALIMKETNLNKIIDQAIEYGNKRIKFYKKENKNYDTRFISNISEVSSDQILNTDPYKLLQVLEHLIDNATKFTYNGHVKLTFSKNNKGIDFSIIDTGIGIEEDELENIFAKFTQIQENLTQLHSGTGIGLTICKEIISKLGGEIKVKSIKSKGSSFSFSLPYINQ